MSFVVLLLVSIEHPSGYKIQKSHSTSGTLAQVAFFIVTLGYFNLAPHLALDMYRLHENAMKREYGARIHDVGCAFTPLVLSTTGGMAWELITFYQHWADCLAEKFKIIILFISLTIYLFT